MDIFFDLPTKSRIQQAYKTLSHTELAGNGRARFLTKRRIQTAFFICLQKLCHKLCELCHYLCELCQDEHFEMFLLYNIHKEGDRMDRLSKIMTEQLIRKNKIDAQQSEIYRYGLRLILADLVNFAIILACGVLLKRVLCALVFLLVFCSVRKYSGGFHAKTFWLCRLTMAVTFLSVVGVSEMLCRNPYGTQTLIVLNLVSVAVIACFAPVRHPNKKLTEKQKKTNKRNAVTAAVVFGAVSAGLIKVNNTISVTIGLTLTAIAVLVLIGILNTRGGKQNAGLDL